MKHLSNDRIFWGAVGLGGVLLVSLIFFWAIPARQAAQTAEIAWGRMRDRAGALHNSANKIPSDQAMKSAAEYCDWLKGQVHLVETSFADRGGALESPLITEGTVTPAEFKAVYLTTVDKYAVWLKQQKGFTISPNVAVFDGYDWLTGLANPKEENYTDIVRRYRTRLAIYRLCSGKGVRELRRLQLGPRAPLTPEFDGVRIEMDVLVPPERVTEFTEEVLRVSASVKDKPLIQLDQLTLQADSGTAPLLFMRLTGHVLFIKEGAGS